MLPSIGLLFITRDNLIQRGTKPIILFVVIYVNNKFCSGIKVSTKYNVMKQ